MSACMGHVPCKGGPHTAVVVLTSEIPRSVRNDRALGLGTGVYGYPFHRDESGSNDGRQSELKNLSKL
jgi:hypothetical protein